jgi:predicted DCC family thiol-disulfide oxidoreductase YuxK
MNLMYSISNLLSGRITNGLKRAFTIDYRSLALFRVIIGVIILVDLYFRTQYFTALFTDQGILPRSNVIHWFGDASYSLYFINGSSFFNGLLIVISIFAAFGLILGYKTKLSTIISWVLLVSLHHRTSIISTGADDLMRLLLFWGMFLPIGARYSIDAAVEKGTPYLKSGHFSVASIGMLLQVMYVYWIGALLKNHFSWTEEFSAVYYALNAEHISTSFGLWFLDYFSQYLSYITKFVLYIELYGPLFLIAPFFLLWFRMPVLILLILMHIGFVILLNVGHFPYVSICSLLLFLPKEFWDKLKSKLNLNRNKEVVVYYDEACDFCYKTVLILKQLLMIPSICVSPAQKNDVAAPLLIKHNSWVVQSADHKLLLKWNAFVYLVSLSPILFWLQWPLKLLAQLKIGDFLYNFIGNRRSNLSHVTKKLLPWRNTTGITSNWNNLIAGLFLLICLHINLYGVYPEKFPKAPNVINHSIKMFGLWQKWSMFAPKPIQQTRWPIFEGVRRDDQRVDIFRQQIGVASIKKPDHVLQDYNYYRWRKYFGNIYLKKYKHLRSPYVLYECRKWNKNKPINEQIYKISLKMGIEQTLLKSELEESKIISLGIWNC